MIPTLAAPNTTNPTAEPPATATHHPYSFQTLLPWYEFLISLPAIALLVLNFDDALIAAWHLDRLGGSWWRFFSVDRGPLIEAAIVLPFLPFLVRFSRSGIRSLATGVDAAVGLFLLGAQIGYLRAIFLAQHAFHVIDPTERLVPYASRTRLLGCLGAILLFYLVYHRSSTLASLRRSLLALVVTSGIVSLLTLSLLAYQLDPSPATRLLALPFHLLAPWTLGPPMDLQFLELSLRIPVNSNALADVLLVPSMLAAGLLIGESSWRRRVPWALVLGISLLLLIATGSRMALLAFGSGALVLSVVSRRRWLLLGVATLVPLGLLVALLKAIPAAKSAQLGHLFQNEATLSRLQVWSSYWALLRANPLLGAGLSWRPVAFAYVNQYGLNLYFAAPHAHNLWLQTYLEQTALGVVGLAVIAFIVWRTGSQSRSAARAAGTITPVSLANETRAHSLAIGNAAWATLCALLVHNLFEANLNTNILTALFFALAALALRGATHAAYAFTAASRPGLEVSSAANIGEAPPTSRDDGAVFLPVKGATVSFRTMLLLVAALLLAVSLIGAGTPPFAPWVYIR